MLGTIDMPEDDRSFYNKMIDEKYSWDRMLLGLKHNDRKTFDKGYLYWNQSECIPEKRRSDIALYLTKNFNIIISFTNECAAAHLL